MQRHRMPAPGRWGTHPVIAAIQLLANFAANATSTLFLGAVNVRAWISRVSVSCFVIPVDNDGTLLATLKKWDKSAGAAVVLSAALDLEALVAKQTTDFAMLSTLNDDQRTIDVGDTLYIEIVSNSAAIDTQPTGFVVYPELFLLT
jgi:hypothetical protein